MEEPLALELRGLAIRPVYNETKKNICKLCYDEVYIL